MTISDEPVEVYDGSADDWDSLAERTSDALFSGDEGGLSFVQRRCLVTLLKTRYISRFTHPEMWKVLEANQAVLRSRLNDMFLTLHVDTEREVAYKRQAVPDDDGAKFPTLLHDTAYTREETVLLVVLRERLQRDRAAGADVVTVDREDLIDAVAELRPADVTDIAGADARADKAIQKLVSYAVLDDRGEDRYVITPVLESLLPLERLHELLEWLRGVNDAVNPFDTTGSNAGGNTGGGEDEP